MHMEKSISFNLIFALIAQNFSEGIRNLNNLYAHCLGYKLVAFITTSQLALHTDYPTKIK